MLATGQPTHAFDSDVVQGNIIIRCASDDEKLLLLSGKELSLKSEDLVIADEVEAIALAGVMGGEKDSILPETSKVILEIANFNALSVRRTSIRHEVRTEAATRFEKGIDPERADLALSMAMRMFAEIFPEIKVTGFHDNYPNKLKQNEIVVSLEWLEKRLGQKMSKEQLEAILTKLGFTVLFKDMYNIGKIMSITVPTWRSTGDVSIPDDIMEEIARIHGLENFEPTPITTSFDGAINQPEIDLDRKIREYLAFRCGMNEVYTYPWVSEEYINALSIGNGMLEMTSPPSPGERYLRSSLLPNLCKAVADNLRYFNEFAIFESAQVFFDTDYSEQYDPRESLPLQRKHIAGAFVAGSDEYCKVFRNAKSVIESMARLVHMEPLELIRSEDTDKPAWADDVVRMSIFQQDKERDKGTVLLSCSEEKQDSRTVPLSRSLSRKIGDMGLLSQKAAQNCGIKNASVLLFELDMDALVPLASRTNKFKRIPEYPMTEYDVSLLFDSHVKWEEIRQCAAGKDSPDNLLREVSFIEEYKGKQVPEGKKSITMRFLIGSLKKTLTSDEIESCAAAIVKRLGKVLGGATR